MYIYNSFGNLFPQELGYLWLLPYHHHPITIPPNPTPPSTTSSLIPSQKSSLNSHANPFSHARASQNNGTH